MENSPTAGSLLVTPSTPSIISKSYTRIPYTRGRGRAGEGWQLPGNGKKRESCGTFKKFDGCLNWPAHVDGKVKIRRVHWHCNSLACPVCAGHAMSRAADRITHRIVEWWTQHPRWAGHRIKPIHAVVSVPPRDAEKYAGKYRRLRDIAVEEAKKAGLIGGAMIFHPFRHKDYGNESLEPENMEKVDLSKGWFYSPHFHLIGFGWMQPWDVDGWIVKNIGVRGNTPKDHRIFELARYQLSHCGVNSKYHTTTWIGELSAHKFTAPPMPCADVVKCPECRAFFYPVTCDHHHTVEKEGIFMVDPGGWRYVSGTNHSGRVSDRSELNSVYEDMRNQ